MASHQSIPNIFLALNTHLPSLSNLEDPTSVNSLFGLLLTHNFPDSLVIFQYPYPWWQRWDRPISQQSTNKNNPFNDWIWFFAFLYRYIMNELNQNHENRVHKLQLVCSDTLEYQSSFNSSKRRLHGILSAGFFFRHPERSCWTFSHTGGYFGNYKSFSNIFFCKSN